MLPANQYLKWYLQGPESRTTSLPFKVRSIWNSGVGESESFRQACRIFSSFSVFHWNISDTWPANLSSLTKHNIPLIRNSASKTEKLIASCFALLRNTTCTQMTLNTKRTFKSIYFIQRLTTGTHIVSFIVGQAKLTGYNTFSLEICHLVGKQEC